MAEGDHYHGVAGELVELQKMVMEEEQAPQNLVKAEVGVLKNVAEVEARVREGHSRILEGLAPFLALRATVGGLGPMLHFVGWEAVEEMVIPPVVLVHLGSSGAEAAELQRSLQQLGDSKPPEMREATAEEAFDLEGLEVPWT